MSLTGCEHKAFQFGGRQVILDVEGNSIFQVDDLASRVLGKLRNQPLDEETLIGELAGDAPSIVVREALAELKALGLVGEKRRHRVIVEEADAEPEWTLCLHLVHDCNMRCRYCYGRGGSYGTPKQSMSYTTAVRAVEYLLAQVPQGGEGSIFFFGGEPLLRWNLLQKVIPYIRRREEKEGKALALSLTTNGTLLTEERIRFLGDSQVQVNVSLDGPPEIHDGRRVLANGRGSYARILPNIEKLFASQEQRYLRATLDPDEPRMMEVVAHLLQLGANLVHLEPASGVPDDGGAGLSPQAIENLKRGYHQLKEQTIRTIQEEGKLLPVVSLVRILRLLTGVRGRKQYGCRMGRSYLAISPGGEIYPCHRLVDQEGYRLGDVEHGLYAQARKRFEALHVDQREACQACWARYLCGGGCYYEGVVTQGDVEHPDPAHCELTQEIITVAIEIATHLSPVAGQEVREVGERLEKAAGYL
jgi:uncharacterized protein